MIHLNKRINLSKDVATQNLKSLGLLENSSQVVVALDASKSMYALYRDGQIQALLERLLGFAMAMDKDKSFDLYLFGNQAVKLKPLTERSIEDYVTREIIGTHKINQATNYAPVIESVHNDFFGTKDPVLVLFITDGDASDKKDTQAWITQVCRQPYFFQFVGIGNEQFAFLEKLDELKGRPVDNAGFFKAQDIEKLSNDELVSRLLTEYPLWLKTAKLK
jgi:hypothetical protein